ncbi:MAG TPA: outer membrane beta-barrel protein [Syntrophales bacterium]|nr:outer membrane beta-barrel protein [Syntrophales bacterium]
MKRGGFITAACLVFMLFLATNATGQASPPAAPGTPVSPAAPSTAVPSAPGASDTSAPLNITGERGPAGPVPLPGAARFELRPYVTIQERYTSNVDLLPDGPGKKEDWITTVYPGISFISNDARLGAEINYRAGLNFYAHESDRNYVSHDGLLNLRFNPVPRLTFRLRDFLQRSDEPRPVTYGAGETGYLLTSYQGRQKYWRNVFEPAVDWQFARESTIGLYYRNNILRNDSSAYEDSTENYVSPRLTYWFDQRNGVVLEYGYTDGEFQRSADLTGHRAYVRYNHRTSATTTLFIDYEFLTRDYDDPGNDYIVHAPTVGIDYRFSPTLSATARAGYFRWDPDRGDAEDGFNGLLSLTQRDRLTTYTLILESGYREDLFSADNLGFTQYYRASAVVNHRLTERFSVGLVGIVERTDYSQNPRKDWLYTADLTADYRVLRWLTIGARVGYAEDDSNIPASSYDEWHAFLTLTASYNVF